MAPSLVSSCTSRRLRFVFALSAVGLIVAACSRNASVAEDRAASTHQDLVADSAYYIGGGSCNAKQLALTFDDGPGVRTPELSTYLKSEGIRAVFFVNGACIHSTSLPNSACGSPTSGAADILAQLTADGHLVGNHTTTHRDMTAVPSNQLVEDLTETDALIASYAKTPYNRLLFRAPYGSWNATVATTLQHSPMAGYVGPVYWDMGGYSDRYPSAAADWACFQGALKTSSGALIHSAPGDAAPDGYATTKECGDAYLNEINSVGRGIILMHDQDSWAQGSTIDMVKYLVPILKQAGYTFVRADEIPVIANDLPSCSVPGCANCSGPRQCTSCVSGLFLADGACQTCATCEANQYVSAACTATKNTECASCTTCGSGLYRSAACTATSDTVCSPCDPSCKECAGPGPNDCIACPSSQFAVGNGCQACTVCAPGTFVGSPCTPTADTVCSPCAAGTYSGEPGASACTACPAGTFAPAGATECTPCGSCDDGDACTTDACSAMGCTHEPLPGCARPSSTVSRDGGAAPAPDGGSCAIGIAHSSAGGAWLGAIAILAQRRRRERRRDRS